MFASNKTAAPSSGLFVEDVFSTWLYTGNGSTQTITNGIDLAGKGGLVWIHNRQISADHLLYDTIRGTNLRLATNTTNGTGFEVNQLNSFNSTGFALGADGAGNAPNRGSELYASWTFRKAPKFFDMVTYTGNGSALGQFVNHSLGVAPGFIIVKRTDTTSNWVTWHRGVPGSVTGRLNLTSVFDNTGWVDANLSIGSPETRFLVAGTTTSDADHMNVNGATYVAYIFAHDTSTNGIIQCGAFNMPAAGGTQRTELGWEPQWLLLKDISHAGNNWWLVDTIRGYGAAINASNGAGGVFCSFFPNDPGVERYYTDYGGLDSKGFTWPSNFNFADGNTKYIYVAIRRGPMKIPTSGTTVFSTNKTTSSAGENVTTNFAADMIMSLMQAGGYSYSQSVEDRLRGYWNYLTYRQWGLHTTITNAESNGGGVRNVINTGWQTYGQAGGMAHYSFRRAPGFFDVVCYTGTGVARTVNHNLGVAPELIILKSRSEPGTLWYTYAAPLGINKYLRLNTTDLAYSGSSGVWNNTAPSATTFSLATDNTDTNGTAKTYVAYLFASCPGVSKVGSYTGNGSSQTINCGFAAGARLVMIKRTDSTGDWYVWDTARGIVAANDPHLSLNTTAAEVTTDDTIDPDNTGFIVNQVAATNVNVNNATYIYLAIA